MESFHYPSKTISINNCHCHFDQFFLLVALLLGAFKVLFNFYHANNSYEMRIFLYVLQMRKLSSLATTCIVLGKSQLDQNSDTSDFKTQAL